MDPLQSVLSSVCDRDLCIYIETCNRSESSYRIIRKYIFYRKHFFLYLLYFDEIDNYYEGVLVLMVLVRFQQLLMMELHILGQNLDYIYIIISYQ